MNPRGHFASRWGVDWWLGRRVEFGGRTYHVGEAERVSTHRGLTDVILLTFRPLGTQPGVPSLLITLSQANTWLLDATISPEGK